MATRKSPEARHMLMWIILKMRKSLAVLRADLGGQTHPNAIIIGIVECRDDVHNVVAAQTLATRTRHSERAPPPRASRVENQTWS